MSDGSGSTGWTYDNRGRMTQETKAITGSGTFKTQWGYNSADLVSSMTYPSNASGGTGEVVNFTYLNQMVLDTVSGTSTYVYNTDYEPAGRVTLRELGASSLIDNHYTYFDWTAVNGQGRLSTIISHKSTPDLQNLAYTYDANGNVLTIQDWMDKTGNNPQTQTFTYDALDRLTSAVAVNGTNGTYALQNYSYNATTGNLSIRAGVNYTYGDTNHDHAVTQMGSDSYTYDANGNQITRNVSGSSYTLSYDAENRLVGVSGAATATFVYDGDGNRVKATVGTTTTYVGNYFEWVSSTSNMKKYYYAGATRVAMRTGSSTINFLLGDHLGSQAITTDSGGVKSAEIRYYPWGTTRYTYGTSPTTFQFTGQRVETSLGLLFYNARWYDASLGRFLQADSIVPGGVQGLDRYAYVLNNPLRYTDPSGHSYCNSGYGDPEECGGYVKQKGISWEAWMEKNYGINIGEGFKDAELDAIFWAINSVGEALQPFVSGSTNSASAFRAVFSGTSFIRDLTLGSWGGFYRADGIHLNPNLMNPYVVTHELGHVFQGLVYAEEYNSSPANMLVQTYIVNTIGVHVTGLYNGNFVRTDLGYQSCKGLPSCQFEEHPLDMVPDGNTPGEDVADMFLNWTYNSFDYGQAASGAGNARYYWMNQHMALWVSYTQP